jgi:hypothetical protein
MGAPREACNIQLVKIQRGERIANTPERTFAPGEVTCLREAKGEGYRATTKVKGLSPEILHVSEADALHISGRQNSHNRYRRGYGNPTGSETDALYQRDIAGTWENQCIPEMVCGDKPAKGKDSQTMHWWSDKSIVAKKFLNGNGAKGLSRRPLARETTARRRAGEQWLTELKPETSQTAGEVILKSRMRENLTYGSVRGLIVNSSRRWL